MYVCYVWALCRLCKYVCRLFIYVRPVTTICMLCYLCTYVCVHVCNASMLRVRVIDACYACMYDLCACYVVRFWTHVCVYVCYVEKVS